MKAKDIQVGGHYKAKVSGKIVTVRVDAVRETSYFLGQTSKKVYDVTNLSTGRKTTFRSAAKFRCSVNASFETAWNATKPTKEAHVSKKQVLECKDCKKPIFVEGEYQETGEELCQICDPAYAHQRDNKYYKLSPEEQNRFIQALDAYQHQRKTNY